MRWNPSALFPFSWKRPSARGKHTGAGRRPRLEELEPRVLLSADVLTWHNDNARTGLYGSETQLTPQNVNSNSFGLLFTLPADGKVDAAPLFKSGVVIHGQGIHNVAFIASEHDTVYAYDADNGQLLWQASMLGDGEVPSDDRGSTQVTPEIGITATPVIDPTTNTMYVVAMSKLVSGGTTTYFQRLHALDIGTGQDVLTPTNIDSSISVPGGGPGGDGTNVFFDPKQYKERDALLLVNGQVYTSWASHSDIAPYTGWVMAFSASDLSLTAVLNVNPNGTPNSPFLGDGSGNSFWNSGAGPAADAAGNVYNISGNGPFDENLDANGFPTSQDYGDSYLKFSLDPTNGLAVADYWTPYNQQHLADNDLDLGSSGILLLPDLTDANGQVRHQAIGSGKDGNLYLVDRDNMGKFVSGSNSSIYQEVSGAIGSEFSAPAYFSGQVYFGGVSDFIKAFQLTDALLGSSPASETANRFGYPGATPSISANGTADGIVWAAENGSVAVLHAYDASDLSTELYNSNQAPNGRDHFGEGNKFITPVIADGKVFVGTTTGVGVFGLLFSQTQVDLSGAYNVEGLTADGAAFTGGGLDGNGFALSADLLNSSQAWHNTTFSFGPTGSANAVSAAGQTIDLPAGSFTDLRLLATAVNGSQTDVAFTVTYTDGSTDTFTPSISDWTAPQNYAGEAVAMPYRNAADGSKDTGTFSLYGYDLALDGSKQVQSITLPDNGNVIVLGMTLVS
jgi:hypothetical protein